MVTHMRSSLLGETSTHCQNDIGHPYQGRPAHLVNGDTPEVILVRWDQHTKLTLSLMIHMRSSWVGDPSTPKMWFSWSRSGSKLRLAFNSSLSTLCIAWLFPCLMSFLATACPNAFMGVHACVHVCASEWGCWVTSSFSYICASLFKYTQLSKISKLIPLLHSRCFASSLQIPLQRSHSS